ncbi:MAG: single-stranded DNA-binding protein [Vicinamibacterales bacterium]
MEREHPPETPDPGDRTDPTASRFSERSAATPRERQLEQAVVQLLDALERCGGDDRDCPHCGPARQFAVGLLTEPLEGPEPEGWEERSERVRLSGRLGAEMSFRVTKRGHAIARFPLGVTGDDGEASWHQVVAFGARAERLRGRLTKGQRVDVVGYWHDREARTRGGRVQLVRELYAAAVLPS